MIINIAGTSGSGKSHLVRSFLDWTDNEGARRSAIYMDGRVPPIGYQFTRLPRMPAVHLVGAYETPTGGCDTINDVELAYSQVEKAHNRGNNVVYEGLFMMNMTRGPALAETVGPENMAVIQLNTPFAVCVASVNDRRAERGEGQLLTKTNTKGNFVRAENYCKKMKAIGVRVIRVHRDNGLSTLLELLRA